MARRKKFQLDLPSDGRVYVVEPEYQFFNGHVYRKNSVGDYFVDVDKKRHRLHIDVYEFHKGKIPKGYIIHHTHRNPDGSFDKNENNIEWLQMMKQSEHAALHSKNQTPIEKVCAWCGNRFTTTAHQKKYCSDTCRSNLANYKYKKKIREEYYPFNESVNNVSAIEAPPADLTVINDKENNNEVRRCPICYKPFIVKTYSRQITCGDKNCALMSFRLTRAKIDIERRRLERNNGVELFINKKIGFRIRGLLINGESWFVGRDVARALGYSNTRDAIHKHVKDTEKQKIDLTKVNLAGVANHHPHSDATFVDLAGVAKRDSYTDATFVDLAGVANHHPHSDATFKPASLTTIINLSGLFRLVFKSRLPTAELFKDWILKNVLPRLFELGNHMPTTINPAALPALEAPTVDVPAAAEPVQLTLDIEPVQSK